MRHAIRLPHLHGDRADLKRKRLGLVAEQGVFHQYILQRSDQHEQNRQDEEERDRSCVRRDVGRDARIRFRKLMANPPGSRLREACE